MPVVPILAVVPGLHPILATVLYPQVWHVQRGSQPSWILSIGQPQVLSIHGGGNHVMSGAVVYPRKDSIEPADWPQRVLSGPLVALPHPGLDNVLLGLLDLLSSVIGHITQELVSVKLEVPILHRLTHPEVHHGGELLYLITEPRTIRDMDGATHPGSQGCLEDGCCLLGPASRMP